MTYLFEVHVAFRDVRLIPGGSLKEESLSLQRGLVDVLTLGHTIEQLHTRRCTNPSKCVYSLETSGVNEGG